MCIIAIKKKSAKFPKVETIKTMCENNPDGFAIVYHVKGGRVKSLRSLDSNEIYKVYKKLLRHSYKNVSFFMHARIKTHGTININNCHGWHSDECSVYFAHNGILSVKNRNDMTDSETFLRDIFTPCYLMGGWEAAERAINACIGTSKFVFMNESGQIKHYGNYISEEDGMLYSNNTYKEDRWSNTAMYSNNYYPRKVNDIAFKYGDYLKYTGKWGLSNIKPNDIVKVESVHTYGFYVTKVSEPKFYNRIWVNEYYLDSFTKVNISEYIESKLQQEEQKKDTDKLKAEDIIECKETFRSSATSRMFECGELFIVSNSYDSGVSAVSEYGAHVWINAADIDKFKIAD